jgi:hypothetical protein
LSFLVLSGLAAGCDEPAPVRGGQEGEPGSVRFTV